jgi:HK97 gp10 family phage protein
MAEFTVEGLQELIDTLQDIPASLGEKRQINARALRRGCAPLLEEQQHRAPDDPETGGSRIRDNLGISVVEQSASGAEGRVGSKKWGFVGRFAEWGTTDQTARPWMGPAYDARVEEAIDLIGKELGDGIEEAWNGDS